PLSWRDRCDEPARVERAPTEGLEHRSNVGALARGPFGLQVRTDLGSLRRGQAETMSAALPRAGGPCIVMLVPRLEVALDRIDELPSLRGRQYAVKTVER